MLNPEGTVTVKNLIAKTESNPDGEVTGKYTKKVYESVDDILAELQNEATAKEVLANVNYAVDLKLRAAVRLQIISSNEGPDKAIEKTAKDLVKMFTAMGKTITLEAAIARVKAMGDEVAA